MGGFEGSRGSLLRRLGRFRGQNGVLLGSQGGRADGEAGIGGREGSVDREVPGGARVCFAEICGRSLEGERQRQLGSRCFRLLYAIVRWGPFFGV